MLKKEGKASVRYMDIHRELRVICRISRTELQTLDPVVKKRDRHRYQSDDNDRKSFGAHEGRALPANYSLIDRCDLPRLTSLKAG